MCSQLRAFISAKMKHHAGTDLQGNRGVVFGVPNTVLRLEGAAFFLASTLVYASLGGGWLLYAALFLVPDVFMLGYLGSNRIGATLYNIGHSTLVPLAAATWAYHASLQTPLEIAFIWLAHIGFDRMVGYGLKYADAFKHTHLSPTS